MEDRALMYALSELVTSVDKMRGRAPPCCASRRDIDDGLLLFLQRR